jgi:hypothetical protein
VSIQEEVIVATQDVQTHTFLEMEDVRVSLQNLVGLTKIMGRCVIDKHRKRAF